MPFSSRCLATTKNSPPKGVLPPSPLPIVFLLAFFPQFCPAQFQFQLDGPQPCPENPIRLMAQKYPQFIYSPYDEHRLYPPDTDCQFLIEAGGQSNRILLTVLESELEEPIFTECNDFVSIQDKEGNGSSWKEIVRWCGQDFPSTITSADDSILVHFHSDSIIQKRGFNISFVQFELPGCPPEWIWDASSPFCYKQFVLPHILPWADAQKECTFERANLAVFQNDQDYAFIVEQFSQIHSFPWIGYSDANVEGVFEAADKSTPIWPENFPLRQENEMKDCVYLDWNKRDQFVHYEIDDCRVRRPFLCKRRKDGIDHPMSLPPGLIRRGLRGDFSIDHTLLVGVIIFLLLALVVGCVFYQKFKERSRVMNVDLNQRLVQHQQQGVGGSSNSILGSKRGLAPAKSLSGQKAVAAASLAKEKEKERREREQRYEQKGATGKNGATTQKAVLETQESSTSFPLQTLQGFSRTFQQIETISSHQREQVVEGAAMESPPPQSPRISLSPNQPEMEEKREERGKEEEEEEERANMGYEPDSEEEESGRREGMGRRGKGKEKEENGKEEKGEEGEGGMGKVEMDKGREEGEKGAAGGGGTEEMLGKFQQAAPVSEHPTRPPIELIMRGGEQRKEETEEPNREATMLSTGMESGTGTGATGNRMRRRKSFDRPPPIGPLDNVSAISLDEFWQQNQK